MRSGISDENLRVAFICAIKHRGSRKLHAFQPTVINTFSDAGVFPRRGAQVDIFWKASKMPASPRTVTSETPSLPKPISLKNAKSFFLAPAVAV